MAVVIASVDAFAVASIAVGISMFYYLRQQHHSPNLDVPYRLHLTIVVILHSLYTLYSLLVRWPPNLFKRLDIPLTAPTDVIRSEILQRAGLDITATLPKPLETLLTRLSSFEMRTLYVRFGQAVIQDCEHCKTFDEYALFALPGALFDYIREAAVLGLLTISGSGRERWRTHVVGALVCAAVLEGYFIATVAVQIPRDGTGVFMWHDNLWALRQLFFIFLPILAHSLPPTRLRRDPVAPVLAAQSALEQIVTRLTTLRYTRGAVMRDPALRAAAGEWWDRQRMEGEWARRDEGVQRVAERLGRGFAEAGEDGGREGG